MPRYTGSVLSRGREVCTLNATRHALVAEKLDASRRATAVLAPKSHGAYSVSWYKSVKAAMSGVAVNMPMDGVEQGAPQERPIRTLQWW